MSRAQETLGDDLRRTLVYFFAFDLFLALGILTTWTLMGLCSVPPALGILLAVRGLWYLYLRHCLAPLLELRARGSAEPNEAQLLALDDALQGLSRRAGVAFSASWLLIEFSWLGLAMIDFPVEIPSGGAEHIAGALMATSALGFIPLTELLLDSALAGTRGEFARLLRSRGLRPARARQSFIRPVIGTVVWMLLGATLVTAAAVVVWSAQTKREHGMELERERIEHSLTRLRAGEPLLEGVELLDTPPPWLDAAPGEVLTSHRLSTGEIVAATLLEDGRALSSRATTEEHLELVVGMLLLLIFVAGPLFGGAIYMFGRMITAPIETFTDAAQQFVEDGEVSGLERIVPLRNDELGRLATSFQGMLEILDELARAATAVSSGDLSVEVSHPGKLHDAFRAMLVQLSAIVSRVRDTTLELASASGEICALSEERERAAMSQAANIQELAATVRSLSEAAEQIASAAKRVRDDAEQALVTSDAGAGDIVALRQHTASIGELLVRIGDIAGRSDLLALNGSLEATRAGEAGRGFALVAAEMRRLAENVSGTVQDVRTQVQNVEATGERTMATTERSRDLVGRTVEAARAIDELTAAQSRDTEQSSVALESAADMVIGTTAALTQVRAAAEGLQAHAKQLEGLLATFELRGEANRLSADAPPHRPT